MVVADAKAQNSVELTMNSQQDLAQNTSEQNCIWYKIEVCNAKVNLR